MQLHMRENPLQALPDGENGWLPDVPGVSVGAPITCNAVSATLDGRLFICDVAGGSRKT